MNTPVPSRRKRSTNHDRIDRRLTPSADRVDERAWIKPERTTTITLPLVSITTVPTADLDQDLGLASDVWDQRAAERMIMDACTRRRAS